MASENNINKGLMEHWELRQKHEEKTFWICRQEVEDKEKRGQIQMLLIGDKKEEGWSKEEKEEDESKICSHLLLLNFVDRWLKEEK